MNKSEDGVKSDFGGHSMVTSLQRVLIRLPDETFCVADPEKWHYTGTPDLQNARLEHRKLTEILENLGVEIIRYEAPLPDMADAIYVFDPVLIVDAGIILLRMGKKLRRGEEIMLGKRLEELNIPVIGQLQEPAIAEGGDMFWIDHQTLAIGLGFRTNKAGVQQIEHLLKPYRIEVLTADLPYFQGPDSCLHLLSLISLIDERLAVIYKPLFPVSLYQALEKRGFEFIDVPESEFRSMGANILTVSPRVCIMLEGNPVTKDRLEAYGCEVYTYSGYDISLKAEGGPTCLTRPILRKSHKIYG